VSVITDLFDRGGGEALHRFAGEDAVRRRDVNRAAAVIFLEFLLASAMVPPVVIMSVEHQNGFAATSPMMLSWRRWWRSAGVCR